jgi:hypothetical protein
MNSDDPTGRDLARTMSWLPSSPRPGSQAIATDELHIALKRADRARQQTDTKAAALLAAIGAVGALAGSRLPDASIDTDSERLLIAWVVGSGAAALLMILATFWAGEYTMGWSPNELVTKSHLDEVDFRQAANLELAVAVMTSVRLANKKGRRFNIALAAAVLSLGGIIALVATGGLV